MRRLFASEKEIEEMELGEMRECHETDGGSLHDVAPGIRKAFTFAA